MKLTVLGKYGPYPAAGGGTSSYLLQGDEDTAVALDFGSGALSRITGFVSLKQLDGIMLSHLHNDHISDLLPLAYALEAEGREMNLYLPLTECPQYELISSFECFNLIPVFNLRQIRIKSIAFTFYQMTHSLESFAVRATDGSTTFFYSGDTSFNERLTACAKGAENLLLDCCQPSGARLAPHMTVAEGAFIKKATGARVIATHVHPAFPPERELRLSGLELAEEYNTYKV